MQKQIVFTLLLWSATGMFAAPVGAIKGYVRDASGAVVPGGGG